MLNASQYNRSTSKCEVGRGTNMKFMQFENLDAINNFRPGDQSAPVETKTVLNELFELLEDYAPVWYKQEHHDRAMAALQRRS